MLRGEVGGGGGTRGVGIEIGVGGVFAVIRTGVLHSSALLMACAKRMK